ncbi:MAG: HmuY family protein [Flavobacteriales bacterium]|jgi:hypothetical protein|nr:HmuY family protein [Flavobacteriales bacterium]
MRILIVSLIISFSFFSCIKEELPKPIYQTDNIIQKISLGENYDNQVFYDLENPSESISISKFDWDLWFSPNGDLRINSGRTCSILQICIDTFQMENLNTVQLKSDFYEKNTFDKLLDFSKNDTANFIFYHGLDIDSKKQDRKVYRIIKNNDTIQIFHFQNNNWGKIFSSLSFDQNLFIDLQKQSSFRKNLEEFDLYFGGYLTYFSEQDLEYLVHGVLKQNSFLEFSKTKNFAFNEITEKQAESLIFSNTIDFIGHDWKNYNIDEAKYSVDSKTVFIVKTQENLYWALQFLDFYNDQGIKGYPTFSIKLL